MPTVAELINESRKELLDLTTRNRLLSLRAMLMGEVSGNESATNILANVRQVPSDSAATSGRVDIFFMLLPELGFVERRSTLSRFPGGFRR